MAVPPTRSSPSPRPLANVRIGVLRPGAVVGRFLRNGDVMRMALLNRRAAHLDEASPRPQLLDVPGAAVPHAGPQTAHQLVNERPERPLVGHAALHAFRHELV